MTRPDYSPEMLRFFLFARAIARDGFEGRQVHARNNLADELMSLTGLPWSAISAAFSGRLMDARQRAAIWAALRHFPADYGIVFRDDGTQAFVSRPGGALPPPDGASGIGRR